MNELLGCDQRCEIGVGDLADHLVQRFLVEDRVVALVAVGAAREHETEHLAREHGVVGVGHVGSLVAQMAERKGLKVLLNDPPKGIGVSLDFIAENSDITKSNADSFLIVINNEIRSDIIEKIKLLFVHVS